MKSVFHHCIWPIVFVSVTAAIAGEGILSESQKNLSRRILDLTIGCNYKRAFEIADSAMSLPDSDPLSTLLSLTALGMRDLDFDTIIDSALFFSRYNQTMVRAGNWEQHHGISSFSLTIRGFAGAILASYYLKKGEHLTAVKNGFKALEWLDDAKELDPLNADADFFPGLYEYARAELKRRLWWILFWYPGERKSGIQRLERCVTHGCLASNGALLALTDIYSREKNDSMMEVSIAKLSERYPESRFVLWARVKHLESKKLYYDAAQTYGILADSYASTSSGHYNMLVTRNKQAHMLQRAGQTDQAADICRMVIGLCDGKRNSTVRKDTIKLLESINDGSSG